MRIDIGPQGQIVGTKRVTSEGQIAGLTEHAGKDVLVLVPEGRASFHFGIDDYLVDWRKTAERNLRKARGELQKLSTLLPEWATVEAARGRIDEFRPAQLQARLDRQLKRIRKDPRVRRIEAELREIRKDPLGRAEKLVRGALPRAAASRSRRTRSA